MQEFSLRYDYRYPYVVDEHMLSQNLGVKLEYPIRVFTLERLGIDTERFVHFMRPVFSTLQMDPYDAKRNKITLLKARFPEEKSRLDHFLADYYEDREDLTEVFDLIEQLRPEDRHEFDRIGMTARRKRAIAKFSLDYFDDRVRLLRIPASEFSQAVSKDDPRALVRRFKEVSSLVTDQGLVERLIISIGDMVREIRPNVRKLELTMHLMFIFADALLEGDNSPEGIHQDGADYIVSALVVERAGILGGESVVYALDKKTEYLRHTLYVGEGLFQDDRHYWHYVTPIREDSLVPPPYGNRSIIGFDINVVE